MAFPALAEHIFPALADWKPLLDRLDIAGDVRMGLAASAEANGWPLSAEIVARRIAEESELHQAVAAGLGLKLESQIDPGRVILDPDRCVLLLNQRRDMLVKQEGTSGRTEILIGAARASFTNLRKQITVRPALHGRLRIVAPSVLRRALFARACSLLSRNARLGLFERHPELSARFVLNAWQGGMLGALLVLLPLLSLWRPAETLLAIHIVATLFFVGCVTLRAMASRAAGPRTMNVPRTGSAAELPTYSVLVALYREKEVVPQLVAALEGIDWPHGRLDIKLICEADDAETLSVLKAARLPPFMEIVEVPVSHPRTKPKALNYALPLASGEFVVIFDAEDRPNPMQLREAWERFRRSGPELCCLQAPLKVVNSEKSLISLMFAFEYGALFNGLLPFLSRHRLPVPLGGTSNHFRRAALVEVGGWDPFNVTEDADLALRLARSGYRTEVITRPTLEDAPETLAVWLPQRTRWFKGYMQSWLVHMRQPSRVLRELGPSSFVTMQILYAGLVISSLVHPLLVFTLLMLFTVLLAGWELTALEAGFLAADTVNIAFGYGMFIALCWRSAEKAERRLFGRLVVCTPFYWMMLSFAAWKAVWQLWMRPHHWSKTPHERSHSAL